MHTPMVGKIQTERNSDAGTVLGKTNMFWGKFKVGNGKFHVFTCSGKHGIMKNPIATEKTKFQSVVFLSWLVCNGQDFSQKGRHVLIPIWLNIPTNLMHVFFFAGIKIKYVTPSLNVKCVCKGGVDRIISYWMSSSCGVYLSFLSPITSRCIGSITFNLDTSWANQWRICVGVNLHWVFWAVKRNYVTGRISTKSSFWNIFPLSLLWTHHDIKCNH